MRRLVVLIVVALALPTSLAQAWSWPVNGPVLRPFSFDRAHPYAAGQHRGLDLGAQTGAAVHAPVDGIVSFAGTVPTGGKTISIETPLGYTATLLHLGSFGVGRGTVVEEGRVIATVGPSGQVDLAEPFVYFGVRRTSDQEGYVDPLTFLPARPLVPVERPVAVPVAQVPAVPATGEGQSSSTAAQDVQPPSGAPSGRAQAAGPAVETAGGEQAVSQQADAAAPLQATATTSAGARPVREGSHSWSARLRTSWRARVPVPLGAHRTVASAVRRASRGRDAGAHGSPASAELSARRALRERISAGSSYGELPPGGAIQRRDRVTGSRSDVASGSGTVLWWRSLALCLALAALSFVACIFLNRLRRERRRAARIMSVPTSEQLVGPAKSEEEKDPRRARVALRVGEATSGSRGGLRGSGRHLRALPPPERERRSHGEWDGRARHSGHGHRRSRGRLAA